ncbi:MAG: glycosyltransferase family 87 protein [Candidatus Dormiibacterota bacterium]
MVSAPLRWRWVIGVAGVCAVYLMVRSIADLHTVFGGGSAVDYLAIASAGRVVHGGSACVYCPGALAAAQAQLLGYTPAASGTFPIPFVNPALMAWLIQPLAVLPLQTGTDVFVTLNIVAMTLSAAILARRAAPLLGTPLAVSLVVIAVFSLEAGTGILLGQSDGLMLLAATLAIEALAGGRPVFAGLLLAPLLLKPQLVWLVPPALIVARQWRMLGALAAGAVVVLIGSVAVAGSTHLLDAVGLVTAPAYAHLDLQSNSIPTLIARPLASNAAAWAAALALAASAVLAMFVLRDTMRRNVVPAVAIAIGLSVVLSPHLGDYSLMLLAVPVAVLAPRAPVVAVALVGAYTAASLFNPLISFNESTVAVVLLAGLVAVVWQAARAGSGGVAIKLGRRSAAGVGNA